MVEWIKENKGRTYGNYIGGEWISNSEHFDVTNPANKEVIGFFASSGEAEVNKAVESAHEAFQKWSAKTPPERGEILLKVADLLEKNKDELAFMLSAEQGKPLGESLGEVSRSVKETRFTATEAFRINGSTFPSEKDHAVSSSTRHPIGVIAAITPWNFPLITPIRKIIPALAYGCTVVFKPASETPWVAARLMEILSEAGVIKGGVNYITGRGSKVGTPLIKHEFIKGITFTGSTQVGIGVNEIASRKLAKTQLELGGKNPAIILNYHNLGFAAKEIVGAAFACSGQRCTSISRVIVLDEQKEDLLSALTNEIKNIKIGPSWEEGVAMGPLTSKNQLNTTLSYIDSGKQEGAKLLSGGEVLTEGDYAEGYYITPALFSEVTEDMKIATEEIFGPVLSVISVSSKEAALRIANAVDYGLAASVFTDRLEDAYGGVNKLQAGMVHVNHGTASEPHIPFGGWKDSGHGSFSIGSTNQEFFTELKVSYIKYL